MERFDVASSDQTPIAVWTAGSGPAVVLVHGSFSDHTRLDPLAGELQQQCTTFAMDRRGFGASGDAATYRIEREFEDVAAVVGAVAQQTGGRVALFGHSYGASCAMGGAALTPHIHHLVLYEPSLGLRYPPGVIERCERALADGDLEAAIVVVLSDVLQLSSEEIDGMRAGPYWATRVGTAPTVPREARAEQGWVWRPGQFDAITAPTLLLSGAESTADVKDVTRAATQAIPRAQVHVLEGHGHMAHVEDPAMLASVITRFVAG